MLAILDANQTDCQLSDCDRDELVGRDAREFWSDEPQLRAGIEAYLVELRR